MTAATDPDAPEGALFSRVYLRSSTAQRDSPRLRKRVHSWLRDALFDSEWGEVLSVVERELAVAVPKVQHGAASSKPPNCDALDTLTLVYRVLRSRADKGVPFKAFVSRTFDPSPRGKGYSLRESRVALDS